MYAQVAVNLARISGVFDYHLPSELEGQVQPGCLVIVPFGAQTVQGIVLSLSVEAQVQDTRPIQALLDPQPAFTPVQLQLARWLAEETLYPLSACLDAMLPPGLSQHADTLFSLSSVPTSAEKLYPLQQAILDLLKKRGPLRGRQIEAAYSHQNWKPAVQVLVRQGLLLSRPILPPPTVRPKVVRTVQLAVPPSHVEEYFQKSGRGAGLPRRKAILEFLRKEPWPIQVSWAYAASGGSLADLQILAEEGLVTLSETEVWRDPLDGMVAPPAQPPILTPGQQAVWDQIYAQIALVAVSKPVNPVLLQGVTGSGKTELYLRAVAETLAAGRQAIVMVPEIALTPQTVRRFLARFPGQVGLVHSRLSPGERYDTWRRARQGQLPVIVGARSALFTPLPDVGLIVVDECHEESYSQNDFPPVYDAIQTAQAYGRLSNALVLMGSATPEIGQRFQAEMNHWTYLCLPDRILAHQDVLIQLQNQPGAGSPSFTSSATQESLTSLPLPAVEVVDMREELKAGNRSIFSLSLQKALTETLAAGQQAILFLNRRGSATYVFCRTCGTIVRCPRCDLPLTYHSGEENLLCHHCNYRRQIPLKCPACGSAAIRQYGTGTEKVEKEAADLFPQARILRWDAETARQKGAHDLILSHFANHRADILVGTQMLAKGLDLPLVTLVGMVLADIGLSLPDFRAAERTFQVLTQVAGRAGRSALGGRAILQTFQPEHYAIQAAAAHDVDGFYRRELDERRKLGYPPLSRLVRLEFQAATSAQAETAARHMAAQVQHWIGEGNFSATELIGPTPCFYSRLNNQYRWQVILRGPDPARILRGRQLETCRVQVDPPNLL